MRKPRPAYNRRWLKEHRKPCSDCGELINRYSTRCGSCAVKEAWAKGHKNSQCLPRGTSHPNWKGGRNKTTGGYIIVLKPSHPRIDKGGYVLEHILVWEEAHNKPLPRGWIIHHLNGIKDDNRSNNLIALPNKKHYLVLQAKAKRIQELEALLNNQHQLL